VFKRFTDGARRVLVLAQDEARLLNDNFIGTEHILLGLVREGNGVAAKALEALGASLDLVRAKVKEVAGRSSGRPWEGSPPFTPQAKKVLELSLREALDLGHNFIGTEHLLLGLVREGNGVAAGVLEQLGVSPERARSTVLELLSGYRAEGEAASPEAGEAPPGGDQPPEEGSRGRNRQFQTLAAEVREGPGLLRLEPPVCGRCGAHLETSARYRDIEVQPAEGAGEGRPAPLMRIVYCSTCGTALGTALGAPERAVATSHPRAAPAQPRLRDARSFPEDALAPADFAEVPEAQRAELTFRDRRIVEGSVGGSPVQLLGQWSHQGSAEGDWAGAALGVTWRAGPASGQADALSGELEGRFAEREVDLRAGFRLQIGLGPGAGEVSGRVGEEELLAELGPATGGLGGHAVAAEGHLGATSFEVFVSLSGDHARAAVRGKVGGEPVRLDGHRLEEAGVVHLAGQYSGPAALLALLAGALLYFM